MPFWTLAAASEILFSMPNLVAANYYTCTQKADWLIELLSSRGLVSKKNQTVGVILLTGVSSLGNSYFYQHLDEFCSQISKGDAARLEGQRKGGKSP